MADRLLRLPDVQEKLGNMSIPVIYRYMEQGILPRPIKLSTRMAVWKESWLDAFIDSLDSGQELKKNFDGQ
ncbi:helix-turn-helix transcriptional regulator [Sulfurimonas marina]|uniref:AlpA family phage regulatory protein n=1 Tax=Sulfurimonas marina TaxID=2590551 RepID=A0A7M1AWJ0_9BACT|nr:AlpA family phage regulatory protein [Sulfurimonas marina]QOP41807.1 AlpA family phage regulatory protein [Sulfurimonas marina]